MSPDDSRYGHSKTYRHVFFAIIKFVPPIKRGVCLHVTIHVHFTALFYCVVVCYCFSFWFNMVIFHCKYKTKNMFVSQCNRSALALDFGWNSLCFFGGASFCFAFTLSCGLIKF